MPRVSWTGSIGSSDRKHDDHDEDDNHDDYHDDLISDDDYMGGIFELSQEKWISCEKYDDHDDQYDDHHDDYDDVDVIIR